MLCLTTATDPAWAELALDRAGALLVDHAHCELKAANHALSLAGRLFAHPEVVRALMDIAREEMDHFERVLDELEARGLTLGTPPVDDYVVALRARAKASARGPEKLAAPVDALLVGALVEARSCERFQLLADAAERRGMPREQALYRELMASEAGHYARMRRLAIAAGGGEARVDRRLAALADIEGDIAAGLGRRPAMHG